MRPKKRRIWLRVLLVLMVLLIGGILWLSGPGLRYFGPRLAQRFLERAGLEGEFQVEGNLGRGLSISGFELKGDGPLENLTVDRITPEYNLRGLSRGELDGLKIEGVHLDLRLDPEEEEEEDEPPLDLEALTQTIRNARNRAIPLDLEILDLTVDAKREGETVVSLDSSRITHEAGSDIFNVDLGTVTDATGRSWDAQSSRVEWTDDQLAVDRLSLLPGLGVRDLTIDLPENGALSAAGDLLVDEAVVAVDSSPGLRSLTAELTEGTLVPDELARRFGVELPASGEVTGFSLQLDDVQPDPSEATGSASLTLRDVRWDDWSAPRATLDARLGDDAAEISLDAEAAGSPVTLDARIGLDRTGERLRLGEGSGEFRVPEVRAVVGELARRFEAVPADAEVPASTLEGNFTASFSENQPARATLQARLEPEDAAEVSPVALTAAWQPDQPVNAELALDGLTASGRYDIGTTGYDAQVAFDDFGSERIRPWLDVGSVELPGTIRISGTWSGSGNVSENQHRGDADIGEARFAREVVDAVSGRGNISYDWPGNIEVSGLELEVEGQTITVDGSMKDGILNARNFAWRDGETLIAEGSATVPVPEDFGNWREVLANDEEPIELALETRELPLELLEPWLPVAGQLDPSATGRLDLRASGTFANPDLSASLDLRNLRSPDNPDIPPADVELSLETVDGRLALDGTITAPDYAPASITASMPFRPGQWAENPEAFMQEAVSGRVDLPRVDVSRFSGLVPQARSLSGVVTGNLEVAGTLAAPDLRGALALEGGGIDFNSDAVPDLSGVNASLTATPQGLSLENFGGTIAGGSLSGNGTLALGEDGPGEMDVRLVGDHLPIARNSLMIIRANADLRLQGAIENPTLSGTVGLVDSLFYRDIEILPIGSPIAGPSAAELPRIDARGDITDAVPEAFRDWRVNLTLRTEEPFLIRGNLGTGQATGEVRVGGTLGSPAPNGAITISDATAELPFSTLTVRTGVLRFTPESGFDPILEIRGRAEPRPYRVDIYVYGRLSDPQLILTSNPALPESEIMTLLATGTTTQGLEDPEAAATRALQLLLEELRRGRFRFGRQLRPLLRVLDRVDFTLAEKDPYDSDAYSTATISLSDRWFLSAGIGEEGDTRMLAIWRITFR